MITKKEAAIISAYTGIFIGDLGELYSYLSQKAGRPVLTHELPETAERYKESIKKDFESLEVEK